MLYAVNMPWAPAPTAEPGNAPASKTSSAYAAVIRPSFVAPTLAFICAAEAGPVPSKTSVRVMVILTGWPVFLESMAAGTSRYTGIFPPKPPPISRGTILI